MKAYERRATSAYPYFKLATWDARSMTWRDGKAILPTEAAAHGEAKKAGRYRVSRVDADGRVDLTPFIRTATAPFNC